MADHVGVETEEPALDGKQVVPSCRLGQTGDQSPRLTEIVQAATPEVPPLVEDRCQVDPGVFVGRVIPDDLAEQRYPSIFPAGFQVACCLLMQPCGCGNTHCGWLATGNLRGIGFQNPFSSQPYQMLGLCDGL